MVKLSKFGRKFCSNDHAVSFWGKNNGVLAHGVQRTTHHTLTRACLHEGLITKQNQTDINLFLLICCQPTLATQINKTMCQRTYSNSHVAAIVTTKIINYSKCFWDKMSSQNDKQRNKLHVVSGVVSCNNQSPSKLESLAEIYNKTGNKIQWIGRT